MDRRGSKYKWIWIEKNLVAVRRQTNGDSNRKTIRNLEHEDVNLKETGIGRTLMNNDSTTR